MLGAPKSEVLGIHVEDSRDEVSAITLELSIWDLTNLSNSGAVPDLNTWKNVSVFAEPEVAGFSRGQTDANDFGYTLTTLGQRRHSGGTAGSGSTGLRRHEDHAAEVPALPQRHDQQHQRGLRGLGVHLLVRNESLLHSYDDEIRVFPALPPDASLVTRFTLLAQGGHLVSAEREGEELKYVASRVSAASQSPSSIRGVRKPRRSSGFRT